VRRIQSIKEGDRVIGSRTRAKVVKNKVAAPFREAEFDIIYGEGVSREGDLLDLGVMKGILEKSGTWISYKGERLGQGRENARVLLRENADLRGKIEHDLRKALGLIAAGSDESKKAAEPEKPAAMAAAAASKIRSVR
jgi:recombination protein RecA